MDKRKLEANIKKLRKMMPKKPNQFTDEYPKSIRESLTKYLRKSTVWNIQASSYIYEQAGWPLPFYVDPDNIKIGYLNELMFVKHGLPDWVYYNMFILLVYNRSGPYPIKRSFLHKIYIALNRKRRRKIVYYDWFNATILCHFFRINNLDDFFVQLFETNFIYVRKKLLQSPLLIDKQDILNDTFETFENSNYGACICTLYPILDYVTRQCFDTNKLDKDITAINALFKSAGYSLYDIDNLKPGASAYKIHEAYKWGLLSKDELHKHRKNEEKDDLGLVGIALSSFLHFGAKYYDYYRSDKKEVNFLNRHAIIHGASNDYATKTNAIKLYTYFYLMLELEPVLRIVFNEN